MGKINGTRPDIILYDELDILVMHYGREAVLKMFHDAMPRTDGTIVNVLSDPSILNKIFYNGDTGDR